MRVEVHHLAGRHRGQVRELGGRLIAIGSGSEAHLRLDAGPGILDLHALIFLDGDAAHLRPWGAVRLNGRSAGEALLADGDQLEFGPGAGIRIRLRPEPGDAAVAHPRGRSRVPLRIAAAVLLLALVAGATFVAIRDGRRAGRQRARTTALQRRYEERIALLRGRLASLEQRVDRQGEVEQRMGEVQRAVARVESTVLSRLNSEIERSLDSNPDLRAARDAVRRIEDEDGAAERIIQERSAAVCLIQGAYGFGRETDDGWRFLREAEPEVLDDLEVSGERVPLMLEGEGTVFTVEFTGTGFLVDRSGIVLTNRHIAQPWWRNEAAEPLLEDGFAPRFLYLRAYFPGRDEAFACAPKLSVCSDEADLATLRLPEQENLPTPLELAEPSEVVVGRGVLLLGYPSGLNALLARSEEGFVENLSARGSVDALQILDALARRRLIRPLPTRGHISDLVGDKVLFDAPTAVGGSGGPLLDLKGRVVAINYGILKSFRGANFGVPVKYAHHLLDLSKTCGTK